LHLIADQKPHLSFQDVKQLVQSAMEMSGHTGIIRPMPLLVEWNCPRRVCARGLDRYFFRHPGNPNHSAVTGPDDETAWCLLAFLDGYHIPPCRPR
jgi:hypothetical protein